MANQVYGLQTENASGKKVQLFENVIGGQTVQAQAVTLVTSNGIIIDTETSAPVGTENGIIVRNIPSGTQNIQGIVGGTPVPITGSLSFSDPAEAALGATLPSSGILIAASDGTNLQQLLVESASNRNLRVSLWNGASEVAVVSNALSVNVSNFPSTQPVSIAAHVIVDQGTAGSGAWKVDGSGVTQPISGTVTANAGSGTFSISGAVTANAGTNLNTSLLALDTSINGILLPQGSTTSGEKGPLMQAAVTTSAPAYTTSQTSPLSLTTSGALRTDSSAVTQPISGTITANAGTGPATAWKVDLSTTGANSTAIKVDGSAVTQPVSAASLPLPSGAAISAKQPALGTAGSASADVITVQGVASMTALKVDGSAVTQPVSGTITANVGTTGGLALDATLTAGTVKAQIYDGTNVIGTSSHPVRIDPIGSTTQPVSGTVTTIPGGIATPAVTNVTASVTNVTILAANSNRRGATIYNDSTAILYLKLGTTASATSHTIQMVSNSYYECPFNYTGEIDGIWSAANGAARVTEITV